MPPQNHLTLQVGSIASSEGWPCEGEGLFLIFVESGRGQVTAFSNQSSLAPGDLLVVSGRSAAKLAVHPSAAGAPLAFRWFTVSADSLFPLFSPGEVSFIQNIVQGFRAPKIYSASQPAASQCHSLIRQAAEKQDLIHRSHLLQVVALLLSAEFWSWKQKQTSLGDSADDHTLQVFGQLSSDELLTMSVDELAAKFGCSRRHLSRLFHQKFGVSVAALRMEVRLLKASSILRDPRVKIINVAEQCGFNHLGLFNTCFKRRFGQTPGMWRNTLREQSQLAGKSKDTEQCPLKTSGICPLGSVNQSPGGNHRETNPTSSAAISGSIKARLIVEAVKGSAASRGRPRPIGGQGEGMT